MTDGPLYRSDDDVAEALAIQHGTIADRIDPAVQERINQMFAMQDGINEMFALQERINAMFEIGRD